MIQNLLFGIAFLKILFWAYYFFGRIYSPHVAIDIIRVFFYFRFSSRKSQNQQNLAKKITHFTIQFFSKDLTHFTNISSLDIENNTLPMHSQKPFSLYKFSSKHVSVWCRKNICTAPFLDAQELHS